jgi:hypothetical protein
VTTFAVVSGVSGAHLPISVVLILGLANLFTDGFSAVVGNFLVTRVEQPIVIGPSEKRPHTSIDTRD